MTDLKNQNITSYMLLLTFLCGFNFYTNRRIIQYIEELREMEQSGSNPKALANELRDFYFRTIRLRRIVAILFLILVVPLSPFIFNEILEGNVAIIFQSYFLVLIGSLSGMIIMSMNLPFIAAGVTFTYGGIALICISCYEHFQWKRLVGWSEQVQMGNISATYIVSESEGGRAENDFWKV